MIPFIFIYFLKFSSCQEYDCGVFWSHTRSFFVNESSLAESPAIIADRMESRSFLQCCASCHVSQGCSGAAFRAGDCRLVTGTLTADDFVTSHGGEEDFRVMLFNIEDGQIKHHCSDGRNLLAEIPQRDCKSLHDAGNPTDGVYRIRMTTVFNAFCDMSGGGWTVIQRRVDGSVDFNRGWADYVAGFGNLTGNFWAGLDIIHELTSGAATELYVSMATFEGESAWAHYSSFSVGDAASGYRMTVSGYSGTAGDAMTYSYGMKFTTIDNDEDKHVGNCAVIYVGAFWHNACHYANPNGRYDEGVNTAHGQGINWYPYKTHYYSLKMMEFKVRRIM